MQSLLRSSTAVLAFTLLFSLVATGALLFGTVRIGSHVLLAELSPTDVARDATLAIRARVGGQASRPAVHGRGVVTDVHLTVTEVLKGAWSAPSVTVTVPGGRYGNMIQTAEDAIRFDSDVIVFLVPTREGGWQLYGGPQGKFSVNVDTASSQFAQMSLADLLAIARGRVN